ncbi:MAG: hypothetical protein V1739_06015 [Candidatus Omnitrophota bacterium]
MKEWDVEPKKRVLGEKIVFTTCVLSKIVLGSLFFNAIILLFKENEFMSGLQKWLIVAAIWVLALGAVLYQISRRFVLESYTMKNNNGVIQTAGFTKLDTWTGKVFLKMTLPAAEDANWVEIK